MWDKSRDAKLARLKSQGYSFAEISRAMGITRNAALSRHQRLVGKTFPSDILRKAEAKARSKSRKNEDARLRDALIATIRSDIALGKPREDAIRSALKNGASFATVGDALGLTRQRIHQIVN